MEKISTLEEAVNIFAHDGILHLASKERKGKYC